MSTGTPACALKQGNSLLDQKPLFEVPTKLNLIYLLVDCLGKFFRSLYSLMSFRSLSPDAAPDDVAAASLAEAAARLERRATSTASSSSARDPSREATASPFSLSKGGVRPAIASGPVKQGECVVAVMSDHCTALCGAKIGGSDKFLCFKSDCKIKSHDRTPIAAGLYIRASASSKDKVFSTPVGDVSLLENFQDEILNKVQWIPSEWALSFARMKSCSSPTQLTERQSKVVLAKAFQTPAKGMPVSSENCKLELEKVAVEDLLNLSSLQESLAFYEDVWRKAAAESNIQPPSAMDLGSAFGTLNARDIALQGAVENLLKQQEEDRSWMESELRVSVDRICELEALTGTPREFTHSRPSVWDTLGALSKSVDRSSGETDSRIHEVEDKVAKFSVGVSALTSCINALPDELDRLSEKVDSMAYGEGREVHDTKLALHEFRNSVDELKSVQGSLVQRVEDIEAELAATNGCSYELADEVVLHSARDVLAYLETASEIDPTTFDYGGFLDPYNLLFRVEAASKGSGTVDASAKMKKAVKDLNQSEDEFIMCHVFSHLVPPYLGSGRSKTSHLNGISSRSAWKDEKAQTGMWYDLNKYLPVVLQEVKTIIKLQYGRTPLEILAKEVVENSKELIKAISYWVEDSYTELVTSGNSESDVWLVLTRILRSIFEDYFGPERALPKGTTYTSKLHRASVFIWGVIKTNFAIERLISVGIKDHPTVTGAYAIWLISNSGKSQATQNAKDVQKVTESLSSLQKLVAEVKKDVTSATSKAEAAKRLADKASSQADKALKKE